MIKPVRIFVTGSSNLPKSQQAFAQELGRRLMTETNFVLVTGGLLSKGPGQDPALDGVVANAAFEALGRSEEAAQTRIMTMLPETDYNSSDRFQLGTVVQVSYSAPRTRRYSMVLTSDAVVAVRGAAATKEVIDLAFIAGKPLLPIPATGGSALEAWNAYERELTKRLHLSTPRKILWAIP